MIRPRYRKIGMRNLTRAFPEQTDAWRRSVLRDSEESMARLIVDFLRLSQVTVSNVETRFEFPKKATLDRLRESGRPLFYVTGHLGSFELLAHYLLITGHPLSFVARKFKPEWLDVWWTKRREAGGNSVIPRQGALKGLLRSLQEGKDVAVLFDQNLTRDNAVFVSWFGHLAATTRVIALVALKTNAVLPVISLQTIGPDRYRINVRECNVDDIRSNEALSNDEKVFAITERMSADYVAMIRNSPGEWFWMHRRWKTAADVGSEHFYDNM